MENRKGSGIFLGVIGVATLVVAIIGATFAYFSASAGSEEQQFAGSTSVGLGYGEFVNETVINSKLIPAYDNIAATAAVSALNDNGLCIDDNKNQICSVYTFFVGNQSLITTQLTSTINIVGDNGFTNLYFRVYDVTDGDFTKAEDLEDQSKWVVTPTNFKVLLGQTDGVATSGTHSFKFPDTEDGETFNFPVVYDPDVKFSTDGKTITIPLITTLDASTALIEGEDNLKDITKYAAVQKADTVNHKKYKLVIWLRDTGTDQPFDSNQTFTASVKITTGTGSGVTGVLAGSSGDLTGQNYTNPET